MKNDKKKSNVAIGIIGSGRSKKCTFTELFGGEEVHDLENSHKPKYILDSVFPNEEIRKEAMEIVIEDYSEPLGEGTLSEKEDVSKVKPTYVLSSVFPSREVQDVALAEVERLNKIRFCEELGIVYENIDDVSWETIRKEIKKQKENSKGKVYVKRRRGVGYGK